MAEFSPQGDFLAIATDDGRIKIWNTLNGQLHNEYTNIGSTFSTGTDCGRLSVDYSCMKWRPVLSKKNGKQKGDSLLVLGTSGGDVLALDTALGNLRWKALDCHPGGVSSISFSGNGRGLYTAGADGNVCNLDCETGNILQKFRASRKRVSCLAVSSDGEILATAAARLKLFDVSNKKKLQTFTGHPDTVRMMLFSEDGKHLLSSSAVERHVAVWLCDGSKHTKSAACILTMEQPAVALDCKISSKDDKGITILAVSEAGLAYMWHCQSWKELTLAKSFSISVFSEGKAAIQISTKNRGSILAAKILDVTKESHTILVAYGNSFRPEFETISAKYGQDIVLGGSEKNELLSDLQAKKSRKQHKRSHAVAVLGVENADDGIIPKPRLEHLDVEIQKDGRDFMMEMNEMQQIQLKGDMVVVDEEDDEPALEERLIELGILEEGHEVPAKISYSVKQKSQETATPSKKFLQCLENLSSKKHLTAKKRKVINKSVSALSAHDAPGLLKDLFVRLKSRPSRALLILSSVKALLLRFPGILLTDHEALSLLESLQQIIESRSSELQRVFRLRGRLNLIMTQIKKEGILDEPAIVKEGINEEEVEMVEGAGDDISSDENMESDEIASINELHSESMTDEGNDSESDRDL